jgi:hypothetical protein
MAAKRSLHLCLAESARGACAASNREATNKTNGCGVISIARFLPDNVKPDCKAQRAYG